MVALYWFGDDGGMRNGMGEKGRLDGFHGEVDEGRVAGAFFFLV